MLFLFIYIILSLTASTFLWLLFADFCFGFSLLPFVGFFIGDCFLPVRFQMSQREKTRKKKGQSALICMRSMSKIAVVNTLIAFACIFICI